MAYVENAQRYVIFLQIFILQGFFNFNFRKTTAKKEKFPGFFASNSFNRTGSANSNHHDPSV